VKDFDQVEDTVGRVLFAWEQIGSHRAVIPGEPLVRAVLGPLYLGAGDDFASGIAIASGMDIVCRGNSEQVRGCLVACDFALVEDFDNFAALAMTPVLANQYSFEIVWLPEAGIVSAVQQLAYQFQCLRGIWAVVTFRMVSLAYQVAVLSDAVAPVFGADRVKAEDVSMDVQCSAWNRAIFGFVEFAGLAFVVFGSPSRHSVRPYSCWLSCLGSLPPMIDVSAEKAVP
jgi:hypothetical protein